MKSILRGAIVCVVWAVLSTTACLAADGELTLFCGAAFKKPMEEVVEAFQRKEGVRTNATYAGTGTLFSQLLLTKCGDVFIAPTPDVFEKAREKRAIVAESVRSFAFMVPCINVQKGNPKKIAGLRDLLRPGIRVAIGNPEIVFVGMLSVEIADKSFDESEKRLFRNNLVTFAEDFNKLATFLVLKQVDAVIGFHFFEAWYPDKIETVKLQATEVQRIGSAMGAVVSYTRSRETAERFMDFLSSMEAKEIFRKYHYFGEADDAFRWLGARKPVGGNYAVRPGWMEK
jgi:molybdate transport system substrate-binding protein